MPEAFAQIGGALRDLNQTAETPQAQTDMRQMRAVPDIPADAIRRVALNMRTLKPEEKLRIIRSLGKAINPDVLRLIDVGDVMRLIDLRDPEENVLGQVDPRTPTVIYQLAAGGPGSQNIREHPGTLPHEAVHSWQMQHGYPVSEAQAYAAEGREEEARGFGWPWDQARTLEAIRRNPLVDLPNPETAFLESVRQRYKGQRADPFTVKPTFNPYWDIYENRWNTPVMPDD